MSQCYTGPNLAHSLPDLSPDEHNGHKDPRKYTIFFFKFLTYSLFLYIYLSHFKFSAFNKLEICQQKVHQWPTLT